MATNNAVTVERGEQLASDVDVSDNKLRLTTAFRDELPHKPADGRSLLLHGCS